MGSVRDRDRHRRHASTTTAGYGTVADADGAEWFFHCTAIADGTRTIDDRRTPVTVRGASPAASAAGRRRIVRSGR